MKLGLIGKGAIAHYVSTALEERGHVVGAVLLRERSIERGQPLQVAAVQDLPDDLDAVIDCAGHTALAYYGPDILASGISLITVSVGALADIRLHEELEAAARHGKARLHLASGAIGALDCLQAARIGRLDRVTYTGRKPPGGWKGSPAEASLDLDRLQSGAWPHFKGTAREAALAYPKNANVAAAVALAGVGFDATEVQLIADADITENIHQIEAEGEFGSLRFEIRGRSLPNNPRSSALAAMSAVSKLEQTFQPIAI